MEGSLISVFPENSPSLGGLGLGSGSTQSPPGKVAGGIRWLSLRLGGQGLDMEHCRGCLKRGLMSNYKEQLHTLHMLSFLTPVDICVYAHMRNGSILTSMRCMLSIYLLSLDLSCTLPLPSRIHIRHGCGSRESMGAAFLTRCPCL